MRISIWTRLVCTASVREELKTACLGGARPATADTWCSAVDGLGSACSVRVYVSKLGVGRSRFTSAPGLRASAHRGRDGLGSVPVAPPYSLKDSTRSNEKKLVIGCSIGQLPSQHVGVRLHHRFSAYSTATPGACLHVHVCASASQAVQYAYSCTTVQLSAVT